MDLQSDPTNTTNDGQSVYPWLIGTFPAIPFALADPSAAIGLFSPAS
jgi:hypothetical protein